MKFLIVIALPSLLVGCDTDLERLLKTTVSFAYRCQQNGRTEQECKKRLEDVIHDRI
jgi:hypothetical protein